MHYGFSHPDAAIHIYLLVIYFLMRDEAMSRLELEAEMEDDDDAKITD
jgi:hypothetical protein